MVGRKEKTMKTGSKGTVTVDRERFQKDIAYVTRKIEDNVGAEIKVADAIRWTDRLDALARALR